METLRAMLTDEGLVSFECKVVGYPTPLLRWFKDGQELKPGDVYQLSGTNSLGKLRQPSQVALLSFQYRMFLKAAFVLPRFLAK